MQLEKICIEIDGTTKEYDILIKFDCMGKTYIGYTDHSLDDHNKQKVYYGYIKTIDKNTVLVHITEEDDWNIIREVIKQIK